MDKFERMMVDQFKRAAKKLGMRVKVNDNRLGELLREFENHKQKARGHEHDIDAEDAAE